MKLKKTSQKGAGISGDLGRSAIIAGDQTSRHKMPAPIRRQNQDKGQRKVQLAKAMILCMMAISTTTFAHGEEKSAESEKIEELLEKVIMLEEKLVGAQIGSLENNNADYLLEKIISVEESLANMQKDSMLSWDAGDIIISSATILSFLGFGSFFAIHAQNKFIKKMLLGYKILLASMMSIIVTHTIIIILTVNGYHEMFENGIYTILMIETLVFFGIMFIALYAITYTLNWRSDVEEKKHGAEREIIENISKFNLF